MAVTQSGAGGEAWVDGCENAREFVVERLERGPSPVNPTRLSKGYGCTREHMAAEISSLVDRGVLARVGRGQYVLAEDADKYVADSENLDENPDSEAESVTQDDADSGGGDSRSESAYQLQYEGATAEILDEDQAESAGGVEIEAEEIAETSEASGAFSDVSPTTALIGATVLFVLLVLVLSEPVDSGGVEEPASEEEPGGGSDGEVSLLG